jgi:hypothetical protein
LKNATAACENNNVNLMLEGKGCETRARRRGIRGQWAVENGSFE